MAKPRDPAVGRNAALRRRLERAVGQHQAGALAEAERLYREVLALDPGQGDAAHLLGRIAQQDGRLAEAIALFDRAAAGRPEVPAFHNSRAVALMAAGRPLDALAAYDRAIALAPADPDAHFNRGIALHGLGRPGDAVAAFDAALALDPGLAAAWNNRGLAQQDLGLSDKALESFDRALTRLPDAHEIHNNRGLALQDMGRLDAALAAFEHAIGLQPEAAAAHHNRGDALAELGRLDGALAAFAEALRLAPDFAEAHCGQGIAFLKQCAANAAIEAFERCLALAPGDTRSLAHMAIALGRVGRERDAEALVGLSRSPLQVPLAPPDRLLTRLRDDILSHPTLRWEPHGKTTRGGHQTARLADGGPGAWGELVGRLRAAIDQVLAGLPVIADHPHLFRIPADYDLSLWATVLRGGGRQLPHIHPNGWLSGVFYVAVPEVIRQDRRDQAGGLEIGCRGIPALGDQPSQTVRPEPGLVVLFPSYTFHRTLPFSSEDPRISVAFDVEPRSYRT